MRSTTAMRLCNKMCIEYKCNNNTINFRTLSLKLKFENKLISTLNELVYLGVNGNGYVLKSGYFYCSFIKCMH